VIDKPKFPATVNPDVQEIKIVLFGKAATGKTSTVANICRIRNVIAVMISSDSTTDIPQIHNDTVGVQVNATLWPVQVISKDN
jgi:signal recognition particle receptor subunit beta